MFDTIDNRLPQALLPWYEENRRDLPWRRDRDPYHVWISEIMLQQTRVEAVKGYYTRFLEELPTIQTLAQCDDDRLHKLWEGLGYYSRVRNLKKAAVRIMELHDGRFPTSYESILALPGIGEYTAGAISSIAFDLPTPAVDGNVLRVIARLTADHTPVDLPAYKKSVRQALEAIYPARAGDFTQALMELGATLCGPNWKPKCDVCPCQAFCQGFVQGIAEALPVKLPKRGRREEDMTVYIVSCDGRYALQKRENRGLLAGLWQFPNTRGTLDTADALDRATEMGLHPRNIQKVLERKHIFTHIQWNMRGFYLESGEMDPAYQWMTAEEIEKKTALPTAFRQFWKETDHV